MATAQRLPPVKENVFETTVLLTIVGYGLVFGTFGGVFPYPEIGKSGVNLLGHAIAVVNTLATICLVAGWYWIRNDEVTKHRTAMISAFALILAFLLMYLPKVGGGGRKEFRLEASVGFVPELGFVEPIYLLMLAIHIVLSALTMPVVVYVLLLGLTHSPAELRDTNHAKIGRFAAGTWILSLVLGVLAYVLLNHVYTYEFVPAVLWGL
jgi:putative membrane protein